MRIALVLLASIVSLSATPVEKRTEHVCDGFFPKNDIIVPMSMTADGISEKEYEEVLSRTEKVFGPIISTKHNAKLVVERDWSDGEFNAYATQQGNNWIIHFYGGLARAKGMSPEGFAVVVCHELGHHVGGAPKIKSFYPGSAWASNEGQSDYYATLRCLKQLWTPEENADFVKNQKIDTIAKKSCEAAHNNVEEQNYCMRATSGALALTTAFNIVTKSKTPLSLDTPDQKVVKRIDDSHPQSQCRLDTYYQGALCNADVNIDLDNKDPRVGTCASENGAKSGTRPLCWYAPL